MQERTQNKSQHVMNKRLSCRRGHNIYLNQTPPMPARIQNASQLSWPNPSQAIEDKKCFTKCVHQTPKLPVRTKYVSQHVLTEAMVCQRGHQNASQLVMTKYIPFQQGHKMYLSLR
jgi:hypothetical protein